MDRNCLSTFSTVSLLIDYRGVDVVVVVVVPISPPLRKICVAAVAAVALM